MLNRVILVGRVVELINNDNEELIIKLKVPRYYKNDNGEYENDIITCVTYRGISKQVSSYVKNNDMISIRGCLKSLEDNILVVMVEKITFLTSKGE